MRRVMTMANMPSLSASILVLPISKVVVSKVMEIALRFCDSLRPPGLHRSACWTAVGFFDQAAQCRVDVPGVLRRYRVNQLVGVVIHLISALRANHLALLFSHLVLLFSCPEQYCPGRSARFSPSKRVRSKTCRRGTQ